MEKFGEVERILTLAGGESGIESYAVSGGFGEESTKVFGKGAGAEDFAIDPVKEVFLDSEKSIVSGWMIAFCVVSVVAAIAIAVLFYNLFKKKKNESEVTVNAITNKSEIIKLQNQIEEMHWDALVQDVLCVLSATEHLAAFEKAKVGTEEQKSALRLFMCTLRNLRPFNVNLNSKNFSNLHAYQEELLNMRNKFEELYQELGENVFKNGAFPKWLPLRFRWVSDAYRTQFIDCWFKTLNDKDSEEEKNTDFLFSVPSEVFAMGYANMRTEKAMKRLKMLKNEETTSQDKESAIKIIHKCAKWAISCDEQANKIVIYGTLIDMWVLLHKNVTNDEKIKSVARLTKILDSHQLENFEVGADIAKKLNDKIKYWHSFFEQNQELQGDVLTGGLVEIQSDLEKYILIFANSFVDNVRSQINQNHSDNIENTLAQLNNDEIEELGEKLYKMSCDRVYSRNHNGNDCFWLLTDHEKTSNYGELSKVLKNFGDNYGQIIDKYLSASTASDNADINTEDMRKIILNFYNELNQLSAKISSRIEAREVDNSQQQANTEAKASQNNADLTKPFIPPAVNVDSAVVL